MRKLHNVGDIGLRSDSPVSSDATSPTSESSTAAAAAVVGHRAWQAAVSFRNRNLASEFSSSFMISNGASEPVPGSGNAASFASSNGRQTRFDIAKVF